MTDRGRVPFALIGVLVLVATIGIVTTTHAPTPSEPAVDRELDRLAAETQTALREAALTAAHEAAASPVTEPADTPMGAAIRPESAFTDGLKVRLFVQAREHLDGLEASRDELSLSVSMRETTTPAELRAARDDVTVARAGENESKLRVELANVTLTASRDGQTVASRTIAPTVVVDSPVLVVRDRVAEFERQLEAGITDPGLTRRLSAQLHLAAFARGYAQYGGAPIQAVVANRHVELFANRALFDIQRSVFGHSDPVGRAALRDAALETGITDLLAGIDHDAVDHLEAAREYAGLTRAPEDKLAELAPTETYPSPHDAVTTGVNDSAGRVFLAFLGETGAPPGDTDGDDASVGVPSGSAGSHVRTALDAFGSTNENLTVPPYDFTSAVDRTFTETARIAASVRTLERSRETTGAPSASWSVLSSQTTTDISVSDRTTSTPPTERGWTTHASYARTVERERTTVTRYQTPQGNRTTRETVTTTYAVDLAVLGRHALGPAPAAPVETVYESPGPYGGPNLGDVPDRARERLIEGRGGPDELAMQAVTGTIDTEPIEIQGEYPEPLLEELYTDLVELRQQVANVSTSNPRGLVGTYQVNPPKQLAEQLRERRSAWIRDPDSYETVADRARTAVRAAYLEWVETWLEAQAVEHRQDGERLADELPPGAYANMTAGLSATQRPQTAPANETTVPMRVAASPSYLPRGAVASDVVPELPDDRRWYPLAVRNENLVAVPYGDVASTLTRLLFGPERTELRVGAEVLQAARQTTDSVQTDQNETVSIGQGTFSIGQDPDVTEYLAQNREALQEEVDAGTDHLRSVARTTLAEYDLGTPESRQSVVSTALADWDEPDQEALAFANGSAADAIVAATTDRWGGQLPEAVLDRLTLEIEAEIEAARLDTATRQRVSLVEATDNAVEEFARDRVEEIIADGVEAVANRTAERLLGHTLSTLPQGVPVLTPPLPWVVTANYWEVELRATYPRFTVRAPYGAPDRPGAEFVYVRDGTPARVDVTGDGSPERLGRSTRISFESRVDVVVAVPAGPRGVGDVDGYRTEESPGWPSPGPD